MNILILANHFNYGGISAYILNLCRQWRSEGSLKIYVASRGGDLVVSLASAGAEHVNIPLTTKCEASPKVFVSFVTLLDFCRKKDIDIIHANTRVTQVLASMLSFVLRKPFVTTCHGFFKKRLSRRLFPCWGNRVIAISEQVKEHLIGDFGISENRIDLIYNGIDLKRHAPLQDEVIRQEKLRLGLDISKKTIGHIGRLSSVKGQEFLVLAAEKLASRRNDFQFLIIGDGPEKERLKNLIVEKGLQRTVFIKPAVLDTALALSAMDIFIMPSLQEGLGISILEANAQGVPVAASRVGGIPSVIKDGVTGLLFEAGDVAAVVLSVERLLDDSGLCENIRKNALAQVNSKFSAARMARETLKLYGVLVC